MSISELLETYRSLRTEGADPQKKYQRGPTSLESVRQEIFYNRLPISQFDLRMILMYGIVSLEHHNEGESPEWKFKEAKRILASAGGAISTGLQADLQVKPA